MANRFLDLGNAVVPLTAKLNGSTIDDEILEWTPFTADISGNLITSTYYKVIDGSPGEVNRPFVVDTNASQFNNSAGNFGLLVGNVEYLYDPYEGEFIRKTANYTLPLIEYAERSSSETSSTITNYNHKGAHFFFVVDAIAADATITPSISGRDPETNLRYDILVGTTITTTGITVLKIYPGIGQIPNGSASDILPTNFRVEADYGGTGTITYSVTCALIM